MNVIIVYILLAIQYLSHDGRNKCYNGRWESIPFLSGKFAEEFFNIQFKYEPLNIEIEVMRVQLLMILFK